MRIQNISEDEVQKWITHTVLPVYPPLANYAHITGTIDMGLGISPQGNVVNYRVLAGSPLLANPAAEAICQWTFQPNLVWGEPTWSRIRALVRFKADGTTEIAFAHAILADSFGDPGKPPNEAFEAAIPPIVRGGSTPRLAELVGPGETSSGFYKNDYFGLTFRFPSQWRVADRKTLDSIAANEASVERGQYGALPDNVAVASLPSYLLFFASTAPAIGSKPTVEIWAEKDPFIHRAEEYFPNREFLRDKSASGTRGPQEIQINGTKYYRADRWGRVVDANVYETRLVTMARGMIIGIDIRADTDVAANSILKSLQALQIATPQDGGTPSPRR